MSVTITVEGLDEVLDMLHSFENPHDKLDRLANRILDDLRRLNQSESPVLTGRMQRTIYSRKLGYNEGFVSTDRRIDYPLYVFLGHRTRGGSFVPANPFADRALDRALPLMDTHINKMFEELLR